MFKFVVNMFFFFEDLKIGIRVVPRIVKICLFDANSRYRRTFLGPFWPILAVAAGSLGIALLWASIFKMDYRVAIPQVTCGFLVWYFISGAIVEGSSCYIDQQHTFLSQRLPIIFYPLHSLIKNTVNFLKSLVVVFLVNLAFTPADITAIMFFPVYFLISWLNLFLLIYVVSFLSTRFRDIPILISSMMPIMFFLSPVVFKSEFLPPELAWVLFLNPLSPILICLRDPLIGLGPDHDFLLAQIGMICALLIVLIPLFTRKHKNLPFWL